MGKHLTLSERIKIESKLNNKVSLRKIGKAIDKPHSTISREILNRRVLVKGNRFNNFNVKCNLTNKAPFVCNGCPNKDNCKKNRYFYIAEDAHNNYRKTLVESREGIDFENIDFRKLDRTVKEEVDNGHSFYMIIADHPEFNITERTLYNYQKKGYLSCKNIDLPRLVRYKKRKRIVSKNKSERKELTCRVNRTYKDFLEYIEENNIKEYIEMDTVEGIIGHSVLLTLCFVPMNFMIAYKLEAQTITEVTDKINLIKKIIGNEQFHKLFNVILTDNGSEFKRPDLIENNGPDVLKSNVFYCDARRSDQKGSIEVTHEYIRRFIEQGVNFDNYTQEDINLMMNHINNTKRKKLNEKTPYEIMIQTYGEEVIKKLGFYYISPKDIILKPSLFKKDNNN